MFAIANVLGLLIFPGIRAGGFGLALADDAQRQRDLVVEFAGSAPIEVFLHKRPPRENLARAVPAGKTRRYSRLGGQVSGEVGHRALFAPEARFPGRPAYKADVAPARRRHELDRA